LLELAHESQEKGWWETYNDSVEPDLMILPGFEAEATEMQVYQVVVVPALLQTRDYAEALSRAASPSELPDTVAARVSLRLRRQRVLDRASPPRYHLVLDESVLHRWLGGPRTMTRQIQKLIDDCSRPGVILQVLPLTRALDLGAWHSYEILGFDDADDDLVHTDHLTGSHFIETKDEVHQYRTHFENVCNIALTPDESVRLLTQVAEKLRQD
jgi:hypothetical protein